jgi:hypothetical protein
MTLEPGHFFSSTWRTDQPPLSYLTAAAPAIREKVLGPEHPETATSLSYLAGLYYQQGR